MPQALAPPTLVVSVFIHFLLHILHHCQSLLSQFIGRHDMVIICSLVHMQQFAVVQDYL